ncbi:MAG: 50S ribosomal protein L11 [Chloroflexi bacterium]|nr:50S ribosomal protein L11 [Chloroflexota bacterium]|tara:strand:+ start:197 stop:622 length:426 start_codon:yes stop_codon:yes gene_type:complete
MAKKIRAVLTMHIQAGKANPAPPVGTALGPHGVDIPGFCNQYNEQTKGQEGNTIPAKVTVYEDRTLTFTITTPPTSELILKQIGLAKGSSSALLEKVGKISRDQLKSVAEIKMPDLNTTDIDQAILVVSGTARSMGIEISD